ncbi:ATP-binding protein [Streptomyces caniscabiei]|uniref:ATP-binding protein n=1 Tax=Streptomyces caniscabiei TaxID=2746961 RepID=UPI0029BF8E60|nr:ATP-binding protein [Streptomyces caniscabiei]MDX2776071.1 ATP-binding protein [Streptomyces caniscabiei]
MERKSLRSEPTLRIETEAEQPSLDSEGLEIKGLRDRHLLREGEEIDHRVMLVSAHLENTREAVRRLRQLAAEELKLFGLDEKKHGAVELILSELITNAFRYGKGPLWVSIVKSTVHVSEHAIQVITVTVTNEYGETTVEYEGAVEPDEDGVPELPVHGWGLSIVEDASADVGEFEVDQIDEKEERRRIFGRYAIVGCTVDDDKKYGEMVAAA